MIKQNRNSSLYILYMFFSTINIFSSYQVILLNTKFNISISLISTLLLIGQAMKFTFEIPTGFFSDKFGRKISSLVGNALILFGSVFLLTGNTYLIILYFILKSLGTTFVSGSFESLVVDGIDREKLKKLNSIVRLVFYIGMGISMVFGGFILNYINVNYIVLFDIIILIVSLVIIAFADDNKKKSVDRQSIKVKEVFNIVTQNKVLKNVLLFDFITAFSFVAVEDFYSAFLNNRGISTGMIGIIVSLQLIISSFLGYHYLKRKKKYKNSTTFRISSILMVIATMFIYFKFMPLLIVPLLYLLSDTCYSILGPIKYELFQSNIVPSYRSTILSIQSLLIAAGGSASFLIISIISQYQSIEVIMPILLLITLIVYVKINLKLNKELSIYDI